MATSEHLHYTCTCIDHSVMAGEWLDLNCNVRGFPIFWNLFELCTGVQFIDKNISIFFFKKSFSIFELLIPVDIFTMIMSGVWWWCESLVLCSLVVTNIIIWTSKPPLILQLFPGLLTTSTQDQPAGQITPDLYRKFGLTEILLKNYLKSRYLKFGKHRNSVCGSCE